MKDMNKEKKIRTLKEAFPNDKVGTWSQPSEGGTLYIPKSLEEVSERAKADAERLMKRFTIDKKDNE